MNGRLAGRIALVTGGASGIGAACARRFVAEGAEVVVADRDLSRAREVAAALGAAASVVELDVAGDESWQAAIAAVAARHGRLDVLVNSAGISVPADIETADYAHWQQIQRVNADGVFLGCKHGLALMKETTRAGSIVNLSSTLGLRPHASFVAYDASKAAVWAITRAVALHCGAAGIPVRCNSVHPGATLTPMSQGVIAASPDPATTLAKLAAIHPMKRLGKPEEIANAILFLASDEASFITGIALPVDGGYTAA
jgi:3(or 17)beta-hydroxysteroid dehydrogenase